MLEEAIALVVVTALGVVPTYTMWYRFLPRELSRTGHKWSEGRVLCTMLICIAIGALLVLTLGIAASLSSSGKINIFAPPQSKNRGYLVLLLAIAAILGDFIGIIVVLRIVNGKPKHQKEVSNKERGTDRQ